MDGADVSSVALRRHLTSQHPRSTTVKARSTPVEARSTTPYAASSPYRHSSQCGEPATCARSFSAPSVNIMDFPRPTLCSPSFDCRTSPRPSLLQLHRLHLGRRHRTTAWPTVPGSCPSYCPGAATGGHHGQKSGRSTCIVVDRLTPIAALSWRCCRKQVMIRYMKQHE